MVITRLPRSRAQCTLAGGETESDIWHTEGRRVWSFPDLAISEILDVQGKFSEEGQTGTIFRAQ